MFEEFGPLMTVEDVCNILLVGKNAVYALIQEKKIEAFRNQRTWKIKTESLAKYIRRESHL